MKKYVSALVCCLLFYACKHELERPTWDVDMIVPIVHAKMNVYQMITDSNLIINEDNEGFISLIFHILACGNNKIILVAGDVQYIETPGYSHGLAYTEHTVNSMGYIKLLEDFLHYFI